MPRRPCHVAGPVASWLVLLVAVQLYYHPLPPWFVSHWTSNMLRRLCRCWSPAIGRKNVTKDTGELTKSQIEELREAFEIFDKDGDGSITSSELLTVMNGLRQQATEEEIKEMIQQVDIDGKEQVTLEYLVNLVAKHTKSKDLKATMESDDPQPSGGTSSKAGGQVADAQHGTGEGEASPEVQGSIVKEPSPGEPKESTKECVPTPDVVDGISPSDSPPLHVFEKEASSSEVHVTTTSICSSSCETTTEKEEYSSEVVTRIEEQVQVQETRKTEVRISETTTAVIQFAEVSDQNVQIQETEQLICTSVDTATKDDEELKPIIPVVPLIEDRSEQDIPLSLDSNTDVTTVKEATSPAVGKCGALDIDISTINIPVVAPAAITVVGAMNAADDLDASEDSITESTSLLSVERGDLDDKVVVPSTPVDAEPQDGTVVPSEGGAAEPREVSGDFVMIPASGEPREVSGDFVMVPFSPEPLFDTVVGAPDPREMNEESAMVPTTPEPQTGTVVEALEPREGFAMVPVPADEDETCVMKLADDDYEMTDPLLSDDDHHSQVSEDSMTSAAGQELREAFKVFDADHDGFINAADIKRTMATMGDDLSDDDVAAMIHEAGADDEGKITYDDFVRMMQKRMEIPMDDVIGSSFTAEQKAELKMAFSLFDKDRDGRVTVGEVRQVMLALGHTVDDERLEELFMEVDIDGKGHINFDEFIMLMEYRVERKSEDAELRNLFTAFDKDQSGYIDAQELKSTMSEVGMPVTDADVKKMFREAGVQIHGRIYYEEFVKLMSGKIGKKHKRLSTIEERSEPRMSVLEPLNSEDEEDEQEDPEIRELRVAFAMFDKDGDGSISTEEVIEVMTTLGLQPNPDLIENMIKKVDLDGNGLIEFDEFRELMKKFKRVSLQIQPDIDFSKPSEEEMRHTFKVFDQDGDGRIAASEIKHTMKNLGINLSDEDLNAMLVAGGVSPSGTIDYPVFCKLMFGEKVEPYCEGGPRLISSSKSNAPEKKEIKFSNEQLSDIRVVFNLFDVNDDGKLTVNEMIQAMVSLEMPVNKKLVKKVFKSTDTDGDGAINYWEFVNVVSQRASLRFGAPELVSMFNTMDTQHVGYVSSKSFQLALLDMGLNLPDHEIQLMMKEASVTDDNVFLEDFVKLITGRTAAAKLKQTTKPKVKSSSPPSTVKKAAAGAATTTVIAATAVTTVKSKEHRVTFKEQGKVTSNVTSEKGFQKVVTTTVPVENVGLAVEPTSETTVTTSYQQDAATNENASAADLMTTADDENREEHMRKVFKVFDKDGNGYIDPQEMRLAIKEQGLGLSEQDVKEMVEKAGCQVPDRLYYDDFVSVMFGQVIQPLERRDRSSSEQDQEIQLAFSLFDHDGDGYITRLELKAALSSLNITETEERIDSMIKRLDKENKGVISYQGFLKIMKYYRRKSLQLKAEAKSSEVVDEDETRQIFSVFDKDGDGLISAKEVHDTMKSLGIAMTESDVTAMLTAAGVPRGGMVNYEVFCTLMGGGDLPKPDSSLTTNTGHLSDPTLKGIPKLDDMQIIFNLFDIDCDGSISLKEVKQALRSLSLEISDKRIEKVFMSVDSNNDGLISFEEFVMLTSQRPAHQSQEGEVHAMFKAIDKANQGYIGPSELMKTFRGLGLDLSKRDVKLMMKEAGVYGDRIYLEDFMKLTSSETGAAQRRIARQQSETGVSPAIEVVPEDKREEDPKINEMRVAFAMVDTDCDGVISKSELLSLMRTMGVRTSEEKVAKVIQSENPEGKSYIDFDLFRKVMTRSSTEKVPKDASQDHLKQTFKVFDKDNNGYIDPEELRSTMKELGMELDDVDLKAMMDAAGCKIPNRLYYEDFVKVMFGQVIQPLQKEDLSSSQQEQEMRLAFGLFDADGDGVIVADELAAIFSVLGISESQETIDAMVKRLDTTAAGVITYEGFRKLMKFYKHESAHLEPSGDLTKMPEEDMKQIFAVFDKDGDGVITSEELQTTMKTLGMSLTDEDLSSMFSAAGVNTAGIIKYEAFCKIMRGQILKPLDTKALINSGPFSPHQMRELLVVFNLFDRDGNGTISVSEVKHAMTVMAIDIDEKRVDKVFDDIDTDGNGQIDFGEFVAVVSQRASRSPEQAELRAMFAAIDKDKNGYIDPGDLRSTFQGLGIDLSNKDIRLMLEEGGFKGNRIYFEDFVKLMSGKIGAAQKRASWLCEEGEATALVPVDEMTGEDEKTQNLRVAFAMVDTDGKGVISQAAVLKVMTSLGFQSTSEEVSTMLQSVHPDGHEDIDFDTFCGIMKKVDRETPVPDQQYMKKIFQIFDRDSSGYIDTDELRSTMKELGMELSEKDLKAMMTSAGCKIRDRLYYEDFVKVVFGQVIQPMQKGDKVSQEKEQEMRLAFSLFDTDGDGVINAGEAKAVFKTLGISESEETIDAMVKRLDTSAKGVITFNGFMKLMEHYKRKSANMESVGNFPATADDELKQIFNVFDKDGDGSISAQEMQSTMKELGMSLTDRDLESMMKAANISGDAAIDFNAFSKIMQREVLKPLTEPVAKTNVSSTKEAITEKSEEEEFDPGPFGEQQITELRVAFNIFDRDGDGTVTLNEVKHAMTAIAMPIDDEQVTAVFNKVDIDGNGLIDFGEFVKVVANRVSKSSDQAELKAMFTAMDKDKSGYIDPDELKASFRNVGIDLTNRDIKLMLREANIDGTHIYFEDFVQLMSGKIGAAQKRVSWMGDESAEVSTNIKVDEMEEEDHEIQKLRVAFAMVDTRGEGVISESDVQSLMTSQGVQCTEEDVHKMLQNANPEAKGKVDFTTFCELMENQTSGISNQEFCEAHMRRTFKMFDKDNNGFIGPEELRETMKELGMCLSEADLTAMMDTAGCHIPNRIYYEEFVKIMFGQVINPAMQRGTISIDQLQELRLAFCLFDMDGDEHISPEELHAVFKVLDIPQSEDIDVVIAKYDVTGTGTLTYDEFLKMMMCQNKKGMTRWEKTREKVAKLGEPEAWKVFKVFDQAGTGFITSEDVERTFKELGVYLTDLDVKDMMKEADRNGDGNVDYKEFKELMVNNFQKILGKGAQEVVQSLFEREFTDDELKVAFAAFDEGSKGVIASSDLGAALRRLGIVFMPPDLSAMLEKAGKSGNGTIDFNEFLAMMQRSRTHSRDEELKKESEEAEMRQAFRVFDIDGDGLIDAQELRLTMRNLGENLSDEDVKAMIRAADKNGDGKIDYEEFIKMMYPKQ